MANKNSTGKLKWLEVALSAGLLLSLVLVAGLAFTRLDRIETRYSISQFLPKAHPLLQADLEARRKFFLDDSQPLLLTLQLASGDWLETDRLRRFSSATQALNSISGVKAALSLGSMPAAAQSGDQMEIGTLLQLSESERRARVAADPLLKPMLISEDGREALIALSTAGDQLDNAQVEAITSEARARLGSALPEAVISVGGVPAIQFALTSLVKTELIRFMGLALLACCLTLFLVFSSPVSVLIPFLAILLANIFVLAFMSCAGIAMTVLAVTIPILVSVTVLSLCIHTMLRFVEDVHHTPVAGSRLWSAKFQRVVLTLRSLFLPNLLTSLTTCFGFATLILVSVPVIHDFGVAVSVAVMISWLSSTLILAPLLALLPVPTVRGWMTREAGWAGWIFRRGRWIVGGVLAGCSVLAICGQNLHWSARLFDDLPSRQEARRTTEAIDRSLGGTIPFDVVIRKAGVTDPWNDPAAIRQLDDILRAVRAIPEVGSAIGLPDLLRLAVGRPGGALPSERRQVAESWFLLAMSDSNPVKLFLTADGESTRLGLRLRDVAGDRSQAVMDQVVERVKAAFPRAEVSTGGMATTVHRLNDGVSRSLMDGFWQALAVITLLLALVFRSWRWTLMAVLPNLVPAAVLVGVLALAGTPIKPGVALVFSIALGIAFNNTVYLLQRLRAQMRETGRSAALEIERALRAEGNPCLMASLCLLAGFGIFLLSQFGINRTFGVYMVLSLAFGLVGDLAFMPALTHLFPRILASTPPPLGENLKISLSDSEEQIMENSRSKSVVLPRAAASIAALILAFAPSANATDANTILKNVEKGLTSNDERAVIKMKVVESNGSSKDREVEIMRKSGGKNQVLVRLRAPSDVSGVALLSVSQGGNEDQWLYMPSQKKARRIVSGNKSQRFLDTEFALEDFSASTYAKFENKVIKEERAPSASVAVIESKTKGGDSSYSRILTWVDLNNFQVQKSEYYDKSNALLKTMVFRDYKKFGTAWRAQSIEVRNMQTKRATMLQMASLKLNSGLSDREFTQSALEQE